MADLAALTCMEGRVMPCVHQRVAAVCTAPCAPVKPEFWVAAAFVNIAKVRSSVADEADDQAGLEAA